MSALYDQIVAQRSGLRNWMDRIPGLGGYLDRKDRRQADRLIRDHIASQLEQRLNRFVSLEKRILSASGLSMMSESSEAKTKLQTYIAKLKAAAPGYSGFFAAVNVDDAAMERLAAFDEAQVRYVDKIDEALEALESAIAKDEGVGEAIQAVYAVADEAIQAFELREGVLRELDSQYL